jgi:hypothetical protein
VRRVFRREQLQVLAVEPDAIQVNEVRIAPLLPADAEEVNGAGLLVDAEYPGDVALAGGDRVLELPGLQIVEIEMPPVRLL